MTQYKINSQIDTIELILLALNEISIGIGFSAMCNIEVKKERASGTIIFETKEDREINQSEFFWLGYFIGRDFEKKECTRCKNKRIAVYQHKNPILNEKKENG